LKPLLFFLFVFTFIKTNAQEAPGLSFFCEFKLQLNSPLVVGETAHGVRRIIPIVGGSVIGPSVKGEIINGGADWQILRKDGVMEIEAHYQFKTDDGIIIYVKNAGLRVATPEIAAKISKGEFVTPDQYYFRAIPKFEAPIGKYSWINDAIFVCTGERLPNAVLIRVWKLL
jgi:hypothetical protein